MSEVTASLVKELRDKTGAGMMDCKNALVEANGDFELAIDVLRKKGQKVAAKRADRHASEGIAITKINGDSDHPEGASYPFNKMENFSHLRFELKYFF